MLTHRVRLFSLFGFDIYLDVSWIFLAVLVVWSLSSGYFPDAVPGLEDQTYLIMAFWGALGLFASIVLHELSHSLVARTFGMKIRGITLFLFGGVAELDGEPPHPKAELVTALAGPAASFAIAGVASLIASFFGAQSGFVATVGVFKYLYLINLILAIFNLIPAFPLDGGRAFRAAMWQMKGDLLEATRLAGRIGQFTGMFFIGLGLVSFMSSPTAGGVWMVLIGLFLSNAAKASIGQVETQFVLAGEPVSRFMIGNPISVPSGITLAEFVSSYVYTSFHDMYPVLEQGQLLGSISVRDLESVPQADWHQKTVYEFMHPLSEDAVVAPETDVLVTLRQMQRAGRSRLLVVRERELIGIVTLKDIMKFLSLRTHLQST